MDQVIRMKCAEAASHADVEEDHPTNEVTYNVLLHRTVHNNTVESTRTLTVNRFPESVAELKKHIQHEFHIPIYDQKLSFGLSAMEDSSSSDFYRLKNGDQLVLEYTGIARVDCVLSVISALRDALFKLTFQNTSSEQISEKLYVKKINRHVQQLTTGDDRMANTNFFVHNGGLHVIKELHSLLLKQPWDKICHIDLQYLERSILCLLSAVCKEIPQHQRLEVSLKNVVGSFLRVPIISVPQMVPSNPQFSTTATSDEQLQVLADVTYTALECLCSIAKDDDHQIEIVSNQDVMQQMIGCLHNARIKVNYCLFILSCNSSTHQHLCNLRLISGVMSASDWLLPQAQFGDMDPALCSKLERELAAYFGYMMIAQLVLVKVACFPDSLTYRACRFLMHFLSDVDCSLLHKWAVQVNGCALNDILPIMRLVYSTPSRHTSPFPIALLCLNIALLGLQVILNGDDERQVLIKQGLLDYLTCLPWYIPKGSGAHERAKAVLDMVGSHVPLQPPSLNNIVRAKLAATCCGLEKAMHSDCHQLVYGLQPVWA